MLTARRPNGALRFRCKACRKDFSLTSGTLFAFHKPPLQTYLAAIVIFCNEVKGKSALALSRELDMQYKTAWVMSHKLREAAGTEIMADDANSWDALHAHYVVKRINHQLAYSLDSACTNAAENFSADFAGPRSGTTTTLPVPTWPATRKRAPGMRGAAGTATGIRRAVWSGWRSKHVRAWISAGIGSGLLPFDSESSQSSSSPFGETVLSKAPRSGIKVRVADVPAILGMVARGDRRHDIAAWFGLNQGRIKEVEDGRHGSPTITPPDQLPPSGSPGIKATDARKALSAILTLANKGDMGGVRKKLDEAIINFDKNL